MIVVDSSVWIDFFNGRQAPHTTILKSLLDQEILLITEIIYTEVLQGFQKEKDFKTARRLLDTIMFQSMTGKNLALQSAQNYRKLRQTDITVRKTMEQHLGLKTLILQ